MFINNEAHSSINRGVLAFVCFEKHDTSEVIGSFISKITNFCFFKDDSNMMTANLKEIDAEIMIVSEFTLAAVTDKGNKPSFHRSAGADKAELLYKELLEQLSNGGVASDGFIITGDYVTGGAFSLDGVHLNARGYAFLANEFLKSIDETYGSNFEDAGALVDIGDYPPLYGPILP